MTTESRNKRVFECFYQSIVIFYFGRLIFHQLFQNKAKLRVLNTWWPLNRDENNRRTIIRTAKRWSWSPNRGGRLIRVLITVFD